MEKWEEVQDKAIENGYADLAEKTADYVRYHIYSQFKTRTVQKFDKSKATRSTVRKFTETENILLDIVGRDSVQLKGLNVKDLDMPTTSGTMADEELGIDSTDRKRSSNIGQCNFVSRLLNFFKRKVAK